MAAVTLDISQTGSTTAKLSVQTGDTVAFVLANTVENSVLAGAIAHLAGLSQITGVNFVVSTSGNAS